MNPLPLTDPTGRVLAYACGRCLSVSISASFNNAPKDPEAWGARQAGYSLNDAKKCCLCGRCGAVLPTTHGLCLPCDKVFHAELRLYWAHMFTRPRLRRALAAIARWRGYP